MITGSKKDYNKIPTPFYFSFFDVLLSPFSKLSGYVFTRATVFSTGGVNMAFHFAIVSEGDNFASNGTAVKTKD